MEFFPSLLVKFAEFNFGLSMKQNAHVTYMLPCPEINFKAYCPFMLE